MLQGHLYQNFGILVSDYKAVKLQLGPVQYGERQQPELTLPVLYRPEL
jgi:hypothetical protein